MTTKGQTEYLEAGSEGMAVVSRPGCVTAYAILLAITAGLVALGGFVGGLGMTGSGSGEGILGLIIIIIAGGFGALNFWIARGLWNLKNSARVALMIFQSLGVASTLLATCAAAIPSASQNTDPTVLCGDMAGLVISGYIIYWFSSNGKYFS